MNKRTCLLFVLVLALEACTRPLVPKPRGYFRIDLPEHSYAPYSSGCPFSLEIPVHSRIEILRDGIDSCWFNVYYPKNKARIHFTYDPIHGNMAQLLNDTYELTYHHEMMANAIERSPIERPADHVFGQVYDIRGEAASQVQFYLTDSTSHFLRASLYFDSRPNPDSIAPVLQFIREDIKHMCETVQWRAAGKP